MNESGRWITKCEDAGDGTGDVIVTLPPDFIAKLGMKAGDELSVEVVCGAIVLTRKATPS